jgi:hypothetical protein
VQNRTKFFSGAGIGIDAGGSKTVPCGRHELGHTATSEHKPVGRSERSGVRSHAVLGIADAGIQPCTRCGQSNASDDGGFGTIVVGRKTRERNLEIGVDFGGRMHKVRSDCQMRRCRVCSVFLNDVRANLSASHSFDTATRLARALVGGATYIPRSRVSVAAAFGEVAALFVSHSGCSQQQLSPSMEP